MSNYNETIVPMFKAKSNNGNYVSLTVNQEVMQQLLKVQEGDRILLKLLPDERRKHDKSPHAYLEIQPPEKREAPATDEV